MNRTHQLANTKIYLKKKKTTFKTWSFGTINIRSGKKKDESAKIYLITMEVAKTSLILCFLRENTYRNSGKKVVPLDSSDTFDIHWCGTKKSRKTAVEFLTNQMFLNQ